MTVIERCSLRPRSDPPVDSAIGQSRPAITVPLTGIYWTGPHNHAAADLIDGDHDSVASVRGAVVT
jgi:hypothetical protein